jgi:hypothetical protein
MLRHTTMSASPTLFFVVTPTRSARSCLSLTLSLVCVNIIPGATSMTRYVVSLHIPFRSSPGSGLVGVGSERDADGMRHRSTRHQTGCMLSLRFATPFHQADWMTMYSIPSRKTTASSSRRCHEGPFVLSPFPGTTTDLHRLLQWRRSTSSV